MAAAAAVLLLSAAGLGAAGGGAECAGGSDAQCGDAGGGAAAALIGSQPRYHFQWFTADTVRVAGEFRPRASDVFISTLPKSGTTFLQQLCHQVRTARAGGDESYENIYAVAPYDDAAWDMGVDLDAEQAAFPRLFKSHNALSRVTPGARYIATVRDPATVAASMWRFTDQIRERSNKARGLADTDVDGTDAIASASDYIRSPAALQPVYGVTTEDFFTELWRCRALPNVLVLVYEDLAADVDAHIPLIAEFLGVPPLTAAERRRAVSLSSREYMLAHSEKFAEGYAARRIKEAGRNAQWELFDMPVPKVTPGATRERDGIDAGARALLQGVWDSSIGEATGLKDYPALANVIRAEIRARMSRLSTAGVGAAGE